jgi:hypothetical protein
MEAFDVSTTTFTIGAAAVWQRVQVGGGRTTATRAARQLHGVDVFVVVGVSVSSELREIDDVTLLLGENDALPAGEADILEVLRECVMVSVSVEVGVAR